MLLISMLYIAAADVVRIVHHESIKEEPTDLWTMMRFIQYKEMKANTDYMRNIRAYLFRSPTDACRWYGVSCNGKRRVIALDLNFRNAEAGHRRPIVAMDWLPSECRRLRFTRVLTIDGFVSERLPRSLRSMLLDECDLHEGETPVGRRVNLNKLPGRMEEMLIFNGWFIGDIAIAHLPPSMRVLAIFNIGIKRAIIDNSSLSNNIKHIFIVNRLRPVKMITADGHSLDARVCNKSRKEFALARSSFPDSNVI